MKNSKYMTRINRLPTGTKLEKKPHGEVDLWEGEIELNSTTIGPITNADLGTLVEHLLILNRRHKQGGLVKKDG